MDKKSCHFRCIRLTHFQELKYINVTTLASFQISSGFFFVMVIYVTFISIYPNVLNSSSLKAYIQRIIGNDHI
jgi:hypothetical protein